MSTSNLRHGRPAHSRPSKTFPKSQPSPLGLDLTLLKDKYLPKILLGPLGISTPPELLVRSAWEHRSKIRIFFFHQRVFLLPWTSVRTVSLSEEPPFCVILHPFPWRHSWLT